MFNCIVRLSDQFEHTVLGVRNAPLSHLLCQFASLQRACANWTGPYSLASLHLRTCVERLSGLFRDFSRRLAPDDDDSFRFRGPSTARENRPTLEHYWKKMVGAARFELATPGPPDRCANRAAPRSVSSSRKLLHPSGRQVNRNMTDRSLQSARC